MENSKINTRYAKALLDLALERGSSEAVYRDMLQVSQLCITNRDLMLMLASPVIRPDKKQNVVKEIFKNNTDALTLSFILLIIKKRREVKLGEIAAQYIEQYKEFKGIKTACMITSDLVSEDLKLTVTNLLQQQTGHQIELHTSVNAGLLGGFIVQIDDKQIDNSLKNKIQKLQKEYNINIYDKGF